ncbi:MAG: cyanophycin synthetase, partial [Verrucomicrobiota bacterium]
TPREDLSGEYRIKLFGRHQVLNAMLAISVAGELGLNRSEIQRGFDDCQPAKMRLQLWTVNGIRILDDSYNANADSMIAALETLRDLPGNGRRVAVLGDMAELGEQSVSAHADVGRRAAECGVQHLFAVGEMAGTMAKAARDAGLDAVTEFREVQSVGDALKTFLRPSDLVLLKASRAARFEQIGEILKN